ncbi:GNAT family N-acetyltransferase [Brevundimonas balnearis]|uniref:GNAT family N-acetyltransferase n=1 Tax=Brevundimonas balnearis TaxID=1572858 RepID=A0ABV6R1S9_9CAUL
MCVIETSPVIETRRLTLRAPQPQDVPRLAVMADDYDIARMTCRMPHPFTRRDAERFVVDVSAQDPKKGRTFLIEHERLGPVGVVGVFESEDPWPEVGYWIARDFWGRGIATEALQGALGWAKTRWRRRALMSGHFTDNPASGRVLEKAGFLYTGERRPRFSLARGEPVETRMMAWLA